MTMIYEDPERVDAQQAAYGRYLDALATWSDEKMARLTGAKLAEFVIDGIYNCGASVTMQIGEGALGDLFALLRDLDAAGTLPEPLAQAWDKVRARACIEQERARARREGY